VTAIDARRGTGLPDGVVSRPATEDDLPACAAIWRDGINDYLGRLNQPAIPEDTAALSRLHAHVRSTDPERFRVATRGGRPIAFGAAARRDDLWFLSMLFVQPGEQAGGLGRALLEELLPRADEGAILATVTDSLQPISNALYAAFGMVPKMPLLDLTGYITRPEALAELPHGTTATAFEAVAADGTGHAELATIVNDLDRELAGFNHPQDHAFVRREGRLGFLYRNGSGEVLGYGYAAPSGRVGPIAVRDSALLGPVLGHLTRTVQPRGAFAIWVPGRADQAVMALLRAGLRLDGFPLLVGWNRDFADFSRYLPISPGLL
jgi:GNAT superfamily N-acetyltransferase